MGDGGWGVPVLVLVMYCLLGFTFSAYDEVRIPCGAHKATHERHVSTDTC